MAPTEKQERIKQITIQLKQLTTELALITGITNDNSVSEVTNNPDIIFDLVKAIFKADPRQGGRKGDVSIARYAATYLLKRYTRLSNFKISLLMGGVEHSVVSFRMVKAKELLDVDADFQEKLKECIVRIELRL